MQIEAHGTEVLIVARPQSRHWSSGPASEQPPMSRLKWNKEKVSSRMSEYTRVSERDCCEGWAVAPSLMAGLAGLSG